MRALMRSVLKFMRSPAAIFALISIPLWLILFAAGIWLPADEYFQAAQYSKPVSWEEGDVGFLRYVKYLFLGFMCWTWSNICMLAVFASIIGDYSRTWMHEHMERKIKPDYKIAIARGFVVFLFVLLTEVVVNGNTLGSQETYLDRDRTQAQYARLAILASAIGFSVSLSPGMFAELAAQLGNLARASSRSEPNEQEVEEGQAGDSQQQENAEDENDTGSKPPPES